MISKNQPAPQRQKVLTFVSPKVADILFFETVDAQRVGSVLPEYGTPHPDVVKWPNHKLVYATPDEGSQFYRYYYAAERLDQEEHNWQVSYPYAGLTNFPRYTCIFVVPRADFTPAAKGTAHPLDLGGATPEENEKFIGAKLVFEQQIDVGFAEIESLYIAVQQVYDKVATIAEQETYNYELVEGQRVVRTYVIPRGEYPAALAVPAGGTADTLFPTYGFTSDSIQDTEEPLKSLYIVVVRNFEPITKVSFPYDPALEKNIKVTQTVKPHGFDLDAGKLTELTSGDGVLYEVRYVNAFHSVLITTEALVTFGEEEEYFQLDSIYSALDSYPFPERLDSYEIQAVTADALSSDPYSYDFAQDFMAIPRTTSPKGGPFKARTDRYITNDPETVIDLFDDALRIPRPHTDEMVAVLYAKEESGTGGITAHAVAFAREFPVPTAIHAGIIPSESGEDTVLFHNFQASAGFSGDLTGDYLIGIKTTQTTADLYEVSVTFLVLTGIY